MLYDQSNVAEQMGYDKQTFLEIYLNKGPVYIEIVPSHKGRYMIKENTDYVKINHASQQWVSENKLYVSNKSKSVLQISNKDEYIDLTEPLKKPNDKFYMDSEIDEQSYEIKKLSKTDGYAPFTY